MKTIHITITAEQAKKGIRIPVGEIIQTHFRNQKWKKYLLELCKTRPELRAQLATYERTVH